MDEEKVNVAAEEAAAEEKIQEQTTAAAEEVQQPVSAEAAAESAMEPEKPEADGEEPETPRKEYHERVTIPVTNEMLENAKTTLSTLLKYLGLTAVIRADGKPSKINLLVSSDEAGRIIGRKGQTLDNLQLILNRILQKDEPNYPKIYIDIDGYSAMGEGHGPRRGGKRDEDGGHRDFRGGRGGSRRDSRGGRGGARRFNEEAPVQEDGGAEDDGMSPHDRILRQQALDAAKEVRAWGEAKTLPPMNSHDRRIVHITLENDKDLSTESIGDGDSRSVVIALKKD